MRFITAVLVHVPDVEAAMAWYGRAFPGAAETTSLPSGFRFLKIGDIQLEIVPCDDKVASGAAGSVVYWWVDEFAVALAQLQACGAMLYRGPLAIDGELAMCQLRDPWGNCIGIRGPAPQTR